MKLKHSQSMTSRMAVANLQTSGLRDRLTNDLERVEATDEHGVKAATLRLVMCAVHDRDAMARASDQCSGCDETAIRSVLTLMARQRQMSADEYELAGKIDMADREREELEIIEAYLPAGISGKNLEAAVAEVVGDLDASGLKDLGKCMGELKARFPGMIDPAKAGPAVKAALR